ncbi:hypothetical protein ASD8599_03109 [Ascidiaceihabitans donghaensis]|uniref:Coenzyme Q-binding protein COQ10 START domain-containing protein n=1 Tax=Ascidiaceihabitans donghaensis TaxID=1510460 RepID=A0A2R8BH73_9RHOB|nr:hypothetical protein [Ascidiaceihabitans donghaensis]SPH22366.1 hypothetical protein ASD8599_03109 [Ascidiaceihabitans donghaensis]
MPRTVTLTHDYPAPARPVWDIATDIDSYKEAMGKLIVFDGLPSGTISEGQTLDVRVSLFGIMPWQDYSMTVETCDHTAMTFQSDEKGAGIKSWRHHLSVIDTPTGSRLIDSVEIDAGALTFFFAWWAGIVYRARHKPRLRMLARGGWSDSPA